MGIAERIKIVRGKISQDDFARRTGVHKSSLGRYERGESVPDSNFLSIICFEFGIAPQWLLLGEGPMKPGEAVPAAAEIEEPRPEYLKARNETLELLMKELASRNDYLEKRNERLERRHDELQEKFMVLMDKIVSSRP
jgi:transcriptional regulator with XRE-family HTH domain